MSEHLYSAGLALRHSNIGVALRGMEASKPVVSRRRRITSACRRRAASCRGNRVRMCGSKRYRRQTLTAGHNLLKVCSIFALFLFC